MGILLALKMAASAISNPIVFLRGAPFAVALWRGTTCHVAYIRLRWPLTRSDVILNDTFTRARGN